MSEELRIVLTDETPEPTGQQSQSSAVPPSTQPAIPPQPAGRPGAAGDQAFPGRSQTDNQEGVRDPDHRTEKQQRVIDSIADAIERSYEEVRQQRRREFTQKKWDDRREKNQRAQAEHSTDQSHDGNRSDQNYSDRAVQEVEDNARARHRESVQNRWDRRRERNEQRAFEDAAKKAGQTLDKFGESVNSNTDQINRTVKSFSARFMDQLNGAVINGQRLLHRAGRGLNNSRAYQAFAQSGVGRPLIGGLSRVGNYVGGAAGHVGRAVGLGSAGGGAAAGATGAATATAAMVGGAVAAGVALGGMLIAVKLVSSALRQQADQLEEYSGAIAGARVVIRAQRLENNLERAQAIGGPVAAVEAARGRFDDALYDLFTEIYKEIAKMAPLLEAGADAGTAGLRGVESMINLLQLIHEVLTLDMDGAAVEAGELEASLKKMTKAFVDIFGQNETAQGNLGAAAILNHDPFGRQQLGKNLKAAMGNPDPFGAGRP